MFRRRLFAVLALTAVLGACRDQDGREQDTAVTPDRIVEVAQSASVSAPAGVSTNRARTGQNTSPSVSATAALVEATATAAAAAKAPASSARPAAAKGNRAAARPRVKPTPTKPTASGKAAAAVFPKSVLTLVRAGAAPRKMLRIHVNKGQVETMKMVLTMNVKIKELNQQQKLPPMVIGMRLQVKEILANGDIRYDFTLTETDVTAGKRYDPRLVAGMKQAMQRMYGLHGHAIVSERGTTRGAQVKLPDSADAQTKQVMQGMEQAMQQIGAPLPVEKVGKGAKWTYTTRLNQGGVHLTQVTTYKLVSISGDKVVLKATVKQTAPKQQIAAPNGVKVSLLKLASRGKGTTTMILSRLAPPKSTMKMKSKMTMAAGKDKKMSILTRLVIDVTSQ